MNTTRALVWNTGVQTIGKVISTVIGVITVGLMTRYLHEEGFGIYSTANAYLQIVALILDFGISLALVQILSTHAGDEKTERRYTSATFTLRILSGAVLFTLAAFGGLLTKFPWELKMAIFAIWGSFFFASLNQVITSIQQRHLKMHVVAIGEVAGRLILLFGVLLAPLFGWGVVPVVLVVSLAGFVNFLINFLVARGYSSLTWNVDVEAWKEILYRSWPIGVSILFNIIYYKGDALILAHFRPITEAGYYGAAYRVLDILITLPFMYCGVLLPLISQAWTKKETAHFDSLLRQSYVVMMLAAAPMLAGTLVLGERIMTFVGGPDFAASGDILRILMLATCIIFLGTISSHVILALNLQRKMLRFYILVAIVTLAGYLYAIPRYGMYGAAWLTVFSEGCIALITTALSLRESKTRIDVLPLVKIAVASVLMAFAILPLKDLWLPVPIAAAVAIYLVLCFAFGILTPETVRELKHLRRQGPTIETL